jgi:MauM/NapG family ferredoxin protein
MRTGVLRRVIQVTCLAIVVFLFARTVYPLKSPLPVDLLLRIDPLAAAISFLASRSIVPQMLLSLVLLGATFFLGRFFCGYICPLGTAIDLFDGALIRLRPGRFRPTSIPLFPKYALLIFLLMLALFGRSLLWPFDPLVIFTRWLVVLFYPVAVFLANTGLDLFRPLAERWALDVLAEAGFTQPAFAFWVFPLILFFLILGLGLLGRRFWCRAFCPLGAMLALATRFSPFRRMIAERLCTHCGLCRRHCSMAAIREDEVSIIPGECIECGVCASLCSPKAISFRVGRSISPPKQVDHDRRRIVMAALAGLVAIPISRAIPALAPSRPRRIRPPGSVPEEVFLARCLRCGECMKVCLTNGLQPSLSEAGPGGFWTPVLVPRKGPCERQCHLCGQVCPTQAIRSLPLQEKSYARIGRADVERPRCLEWGHGLACLICDEVCPYGAIYVGGSGRLGKGQRGPVVDPQICVGCGVCEYHCPVVGEAAIRVSAAGEDRLLEGRYATPERQAARQRALEGTH